MHKHPTMAQVRAGTADHGLTVSSPDDILWTRVNTAEAMPGVMRPLAWCYYAYAVEAGIREGFHNLGMLPASGATFLLPPGERILASFHGRLSANVNTARQIFGTLPGVSGDDVERDLLGSVRVGVQDESTRGLLAAQLVRLPRVIVTAPRAARQFRHRVEAWRSGVVDGAGVRDGIDPHAKLAESIELFIETSRLHIWMRIFLQAVTSQLTSVVERGGDPEVLGALMAGSANTDEAKVADDLYLVATGKLSMVEFVSKHGYQGPNAGDPIARVWREDQRGLERLLDAISRSEPPSERRARAVAERDRTVKRVLQSLPAHRRPAAEALVRLAPLASRSIQGTKTAMLLTVDGARASARAIGAKWALEGTLADPEDVFHLFADELIAGRRDGLSDLVAERHELRDRLLSMEIPETWHGQPEVGVKHTVAAAHMMTVTGLGASPGIADGRVRIVHDAADDIDIDTGDILVCPTTDPSWVSLMTVAAALVIDIGAAVSHGAIVARELGLPCVIGTKSGTRDLREGDLVRVNGTTGRVEVLERQSEAVSNSSAG